MKSWGKEIWDKKQEEQGSLGIIAGTVETKSILDSQTKREMRMMDRLIFPVLRRGAKIVDAGVGPFARFSIEFAKRGYEVIGIDISPKVLKLAKKRVEKEGYDIKLFGDDLTNIKSIKEKQDMVFCFGTFGHIPSFLALTVLKEFNRVLKKGGYAYVHFWINEEKNPKDLLHDFLYGIGHYIKMRFGKGYKVNSSFYTDDEIREMARISGFEVFLKNQEGIYLFKKVSSSGLPHKFS
ncbi:MAG: class I SAM-dependent methyltransferase [Nanoarchaeota archaeon]